MYNIDNGLLKSIITTCKKYSEIEKVILFGSRVKNNNKEHSDIDLAIVGDFDILLTERLKCDLEMLPTLIKFDCINYNKLENKNLIEEIDRYGKVIYSKNYNSK